MYSLDEVKKIDPEIARAIEDEVKRQNDHIELIASENWVSKAVMAAMGSPLTNKYAVTAAVRSLMLSRRSRSSARSSCSAVSTPMCSLIPARMPIWR